MEKLPKQYYGVRDISEILGLGKTKIYDMIQIGEIPAVRFGKRYFVKIKDFNKTIDSHRYISQLEMQKKKK